jgi:hypothetical protein
MMRVMMRDRACRRWCASVHEIKLLLLLLLSLAVASEGLLWCGFLCSSCCEALQLMQHNCC